MARTESTEKRTSSHPECWRTPALIAAGLIVLVSVTAGAGEITIAPPVHIDSFVDDPRDVVMTDWDLDGDMDVRSVPPLSCRPAVRAS